MRLRDDRSFFALTAAGIVSLAQNSAFAQSSPGATATVSVDTGLVTMTPASTGSTAVPGAPVSVSGSVQANVAVTVPQQARDEAADAMQRVPLRLSAHGALGWTTSWDRPALDGYALEVGGSLGVWALPWLAIEGRATYLGLAHRLRDANGDGRADATATTLDALLIGGQIRLRLLEDELKARRAWSFALGGGALLPLNNADGRTPGPVLEAAIARHVGILNGHGSALDVSVELRGRLGVGALSDYQSILAGVSAAWEGRQLTGPVNAPVTAYRAGHTVSLQGMGGWFLSDGTRPGTNIHFARGGGGLMATAGLVLASPIELIARGGYVGRSPATELHDWLHFGFVEGGLRGRWYLFYLEAAGGLFAPFGTFRDRVESSGFVSASAGVRVPLVHAQEAGGRFLAGIRTQFGVGNERSFDGIFLTAGFEFEGGNHHASFPNFNATRVELRPEPLNVGASASGRVGVGVRVQGNGSATGTVATPQPGVTYGQSTAARVVIPTPIVPRAPERPARIPVSISVGMHTGYIAPIPNIPLQRTLFDLSVTTSWAVSRWLAFDARASWTSAAARTEDLTGDGIADVARAGFGGVQLSLGPRFRWLTDTLDTRYGWSAGIAGGVLLPTFGSTFARGPGATMDIVLAREVGVLLGRNAAFGAALELRGRTGFGAWGDYQALLIGARLWWEGNVEGHANIEEIPNRPAVGAGWRPGHTFAIDGGTAIFMFGGKRTNGVNYFSSLGGHFGIRAGMTFSPGFEWSLRGGYFNRPGVANHDDLAAVTLETGPRGRIGWLSARAMIGYAAVFGTQRDEVSSGLYAGAGLEGRFSLDNHWRFLFGIEGRFGLREERATDHISFTAGFEFEGGRHRAAEFARGNTRELAPAVVTNANSGSSNGNTVVTNGGQTGGGLGVGGGLAAGASVAVGVTLPMRFALSIGPYVGSQGIGGYTLDGSGAAYNLTAAWVPRRWFSLDLTGGILAGAGYSHDSNGDGMIDVQRDGLTHFTLSAGPRFRLLTDDATRFGWSFHAAGGVIGSAVGVGPLGEFAIARHLAAVTDSHMALEIGVEARTRVGYEPHSAVMGDQGSLFHATSVSLVGAWEGNVHRNSSPTTAGQLGETLSFEGGAALFIASALRNGRTLSAAGWTVGARTGLVFTRGFEWSARAQFSQRSGEKGTSPLDLFVAETGPRMRWGWAYGELAVGYGMAFGAYRDEVQSSITGSVGAGVRVGLADDSHPSGGVSAGIQARFGIGPERAFDALFAMVGLEFEGGRRRAAPFPEMSAPTPVVPQRVEVPVTSPRYQSTGGRTGTVVGVEIPGQIGVPVVTNGAVSVGVNVSGSVGTGPAPVLQVNTGVGIGPFALNTLQLDWQTVMNQLPAIALNVTVVEIELRTPNGASALSAEAVLRDAMLRRYGPNIRCIPRVLVGGAVSGGWEMTARAQ